MAHAFRSIRSFRWGSAFGLVCARRRGHARLGLPSRASTWSRRSTAWPTTPGTMLLIRASPLVLYSRFDPLLLLVRHNRLQCAHALLQIVQLLVALLGLVGGALVHPRQRDLHVVHRAVEPESKTACPHDEQRSDDARGPFERGRHFDFLLRGELGMLGDEPGYGGCARCAGDLFDHIVGERFCSHAIAISKLSLPVDLRSI